MEHSLIRSPFSLPSPTSPSLAALNSVSSSSSSLSVENVVPKKRPAKSHVPAACVNCQRAHLACDLSRPCKRCLQSGREDTCFDVQHKKRGRPKRRDRLLSTTAVEASPRLVTPGNTLEILPPGLTQSTFLMTRSAGNNSATVNSSKGKSIVTFFLSMDICCARVSDESLNILGIYPHEFLHRSLYDFIVPEYASRLARIHRRLLDNANSVSNPPGEKQVLPPTERTTAECFSSTQPATLLSIANGSQTLKESISFKSSDGAEMVTEARFYLGGGLGSDLFVPETLSRLYVVCLAAAAPRPVDEPVFSSAPDSANFASLLDPSPPSIPLSTIMRDQASEGEYTDRLHFHQTSDETESTSNSHTLLLQQDTTSTDYVSSSLLDISPSSIDISYSPASPSAAVTNGMSRPPSTYIVQTIQPSQQHSSLPSPLPPQLHHPLSHHQESPPLPRQQLPRHEPSPSPPLRPTLRTDCSHPHLPRVKKQHHDPLAAALDQHQEQRVRERSRACNTWTHPREAYFREIGSSRLGSTEANAITSFPYRSPSHAMMGAIRHSTQNQPSGCSLNPVATHHRIPSIHSRILSLPPFTHNRDRL